MRQNLPLVVLLAVVPAMLAAVLSGCATTRFDADLYSPEKLPGRTTWAFTQNPKRMGGDMLGPDGLLKQLTVALVE